MIEIKKVTKDNFTITSLDAFDRSQKADNVFRLQEGRLVLENHPFAETWSLARRREKAAEILSGEYLTFCAFDGDTPIGEIMLIPEPSEGRLIIDSFHVSRPYRRRGIGKMLFDTAVEEAKLRRATGVYLSACSAEETIRFYLAMGCLPSENPIRKYAEDEPYDIQMEKKIVPAEKETDCCFTDGNRRFRYRAAAIIVEEGYVLFVGNKNEDYYYSVGGGVHHGERAEDAVRREVFEETGVPYEIDRLAVIHENFFRDSGEAHRGLECHEICFYYRMKPRGSRELNSYSFTVGNARETMHWIKIEDLGQVKAFPSFMKEYLQKDHPGIEHIVTDER